MFSSACKERREHQRSIDETEETDPVLCCEPDIRRDGRLIIGLRLHLSDLLEVQLRKLQLLLAFRDLGIQVDETLHSSAVKTHIQPISHPQYSLGREDARQPSA